MRLAILSLLVFLYSCSSTSENTPPPAAAEVLTLASGNATMQHDYTASLEGRVVVEVRPQVEGYLEKVYVDEGDFVKAGQPLFRINDRTYREQVNNAQASLHAAEAALAGAQLDMDKLGPLVQHNVVSDIQLKTAQAAFRAAKANVEQARAVLGAARINLGYTVVTAPVSGYIGRLPRKQGALVSRTDPEALTHLSDVSDIHAYFSLSEADFIRFKEQYPGATLEEKLKNMPPVSLVLADDSEYAETGKVDMIDGQFDKNTGAITLRAVFPNRQGLIRSGNTGKVRMSRQLDQAVLVPQSATVEVQDKVFVYTVKEGNKLSRQPLAIAGKSGSNYLVRDGLKAGDRIVFSGLDHLQDGAVIKPEPVKEQAKLSLRN